MIVKSVGGVIVLGGRENRPHGEGRQEIDASGETESTRPFDYCNGCQQQMKFCNLDEIDRMTNHGVIPGKEGQSLERRVL